MADIQRYLDGMEAQHQSAPRFMAVATALLEKVDAASELVKGMPEYFYVEKAVGRQQDILGERVGIDRRHLIMDMPDIAEMLDDESFRRVLLTKIVQNQWDGTGGAFQDIWDAALGSMIEVSWIDNQDMTVEVSLVGDIPYDLVRMIQRGYYMPRPMGVGMNITATRREYAGRAKAWTNAATLSLSGRLHAIARNRDMEG